MPQFASGLYRMTRANYNTGAIETIGHFVIFDDCVTFLSRTDELNLDVIRPAPINAYMAGRIRYMLENSLGTAGLHIQRVPGLLCA